MPVPTLTLQQPVRLFEHQGVRYWHAWVTLGALCQQAAQHISVAALNEALKQPAGTPAEVLLEVFVKELIGAMALLDAQALASRFEHEFAVMCQISHSGVSQVLAYTPTQLCFEWFPGKTLREHLLEYGPLTGQQAAAVLEVLLDVLDYLHARGIVHHDIKPENVMLPAYWPQEALRGEWGVVLVDFEMAFSRVLPDIHAQTRMGTPQYMAPEQFQGVRGDPRSDLYSVGALLFDMLRNEPPHPDALGWLAGYNPITLPLPAPEILHPLMQSALQRDPALRPQTAQQMLEMLRVAYPVTEPSKAQSSAGQA